MTTGEQLALGNYFLLAWQTETNDDSNKLWSFLKADTYLVTVVATQLDGTVGSLHGVKSTLTKSLIIAFFFTKKAIEDEGWDASQEETTTA